MQRVPAEGDNSPAACSAHAGDASHLCFEGFGAGPAFTPAELHGRHGVAFVEAFNPVDNLFEIALRVAVGYVFANMESKLDAPPPSDGLVTFVALDAGGNQIPCSACTDTFFFHHYGQNPFHAHADFGTPIATLVITGTVPILDIKQVSVEMVPGPGAASSLLVFTAQTQTTPAVSYPGGRLAWGLYLMVGSESGHTAPPAFTLETRGSSPGRTAQRCTSESG